MENQELGNRNEKITIKKENQEQYRELPTEDLEAFFDQLKRNIVQSPNAKSYLFQRKLDHKILEIGYNGKAYKNLLHCIVFPLKNKENQMVSFYGRSCLDKAKSKHFYLGLAEKPFNSYNVEQQGKYAEGIYFKGYPNTIP